MRFRYVFLASCLGLFLGCGGSDSDTTTSMPPPSTDDPMEDDASGCVATKAGELCVMIKVPEDVPSVPTKVSVHFFSALPPMGPPTILGAEIAEKSELEKFQPGATVPINIAGLPKDGGLFLYGVLYMPGGGAETWRTTAGVDYHGAYSWDEKVNFTGEPMNLESVITFDVYEEPVQ